MTFGGSSGGGGGGAGVATFMGAPGNGVATFTNADSGRVSTLTFSQREVEAAIQRLRFSMLKAAAAPPKKADPAAETSATAGTPESDDPKQNPL